MLIALAAVEAPPATAERLTAGSTNAVATPHDGVPTVVWAGNIFASGSLGALAPPRLLLPFDGSASVNTAIARAGARSVVASEPYFWSGRALHTAGVYFGRADSAGRVGMRRILDGGFSPHVPILAGSTGGDALVAWNHGDLAAVDRMAPSGSLHPPVAAGHFAVEDAAIDGQGNATVIGYHPGGGSRLLVSTAARGARFGKPVALPVSPAPARVSSGPAGQTAVVVDGGNDGLQLLYRPRPDANFGAPQQIAGPAALALTSTAVDQQGRVLVAWTESDANQRIRLRVMVTDEAGRPTPPSTLSPPDRDIFYGYASVVMNDAGDVAAAWDEADLPSGGTFGTGPPHIYAALRPAGGSFGPARAVTPTGREAALVGPPAVAVQAGGDAILVWADTTSNTDPGQRFMAARLTAGGLVDPTPLDTLAVDKARPAATPPLLRATLDLKQGQRVSAPRGRLRVRVDCTSWTLDPCRGRITIAARGTHRVIASRKIHLGPGSHSALVLHLVRSARRTLARGGTIRATVKATLAGTTASGAAKSVAIRSA